ncbi:MAG: hypothetical protein WAQ28_05540 [Bacteroidia bacterium]|jgi:uncharacterized protein (DUF2164 family)
MLNIFNIEKQASKRVQRFLLHKATEENIEPANARLVINILSNDLSVHLYDQGKFLKTLTLKSIVEFFGKEYDEAKTGAVSEYIKKISKENNVELATANVVICENKGELGAHLYNQNKYVKRLSTVQLLTAVY